MPMTTPYLDKLGLARFWANAKERITEYGSLKKAIQSIPGVEQVRIIANDGTISGDRLRGCNTPVGKIEVCYYGSGSGVEASVVNAILKKKGLATQTYGSLDAEVEDDEGITHTVNYSKITDTFIRVTVDGAKLAGWSDTSEASLKSRLVEIVRALLIGADVVADDIMTAINAEYDGVFTASSVTVGALSGDMGDTVEINYNKKAKLQLADITITYEE